MSTMSPCSSETPVLAQRLEQATQRVKELPVLETWQKLEKFLLERVAVTKDFVSLCWCEDYSFDRHNLGILNAGKDEKRLYYSEGFWEERDDYSILKPIVECSPELQAEMLAYVGDFLEAVVLQNEKFAKDVESGICKVDEFLTGQTV